MPRRQQQPVAQHAGQVAIELRLAGPAAAIRRRPVRPAKRQAAASAARAGHPLAAAVRDLRAVALDHGNRQRDTLLAELADSFFAVRGRHVSADSGGAPRRRFIHHERAHRGSDPESAGGAPVTVFTARRGRAAHRGRPDRRAQSCRGRAGTEHRAIARGQPGHFASSYLPFFFSLPLASTPS